jgi:hypothetical protein
MQAGTGICGFTRGHGVLESVRSATTSVDGRHSCCGGPIVIESTMTDEFFEYGEIRD